MILSVCVCVMFMFNSEGYSQDADSSVINLDICQNTHTHARAHRNLQMFLASALRQTHHARFLLEIFMKHFCIKMQKKTRKLTCINILKVPYFADFTSPMLSNKQTVCLSCQ